MTYGKGGVLALEVQSGSRRPFWKVAVNLNRGQRDHQYVLWQPFAGGGHYGRVFAVRASGDKVRGMFTLTRPWPDASSPQHELRGHFTIKRGSAWFGWGLKKGQFRSQISWEYQVRALHQSGFGSRRYRSSGRAASSWQRAPKSGGTKFEISVQVITISKSAGTIAVAQVTVRDRETGVTQDYEAKLLGLTASGGTPTYTPSSTSTLPELKTRCTNWDGAKINLRSGIGLVVANLFNKTVIELPTKEVVSVTSIGLNLEYGLYVNIASSVWGTLTRKR